jgi:PKD domain-containing protein/type IX secretion system substrate protein/SprB-like repeat protein
MKKILFSLCLALVITSGIKAAGHVVTVIGISSVTCNGLCNGGATASISGGVGPFTYSWAPSGGTSASASALCAGSYTVTVTDMSDMSTAAASVVITQPPALAVTIPAAGPVCSGTCITLNAMPTGGTAGYAYFWAPTSVLTWTLADCPTTTTTYTVAITDMNGCTATAVTTVNVNPAPVFNMPASYSQCAGWAVAIGDTNITGYTYSWVPTTSISSTSVSNPVVAVPTSTTYTVTYTSPAGCTATLTTVVLVNSPIISNTSSVNTSSCIACDGSASVAPVGGSAPYTYMWSTGNTTGTSPSACAGTYSVSITDNLGCTTTDSVTVFATNNVAANFTMVPDSTDAFNFFCFNTSTGPSMTYLWDFADGVVSSLPSPSHMYTALGTYNICLVAYSFVCGSDTLCLAQAVTGVLSSCVALFNIADDTTTADPNALYVYNLSYGATLSYLWDFGDGTTSALATPSHIYSGTGPYNLCLTVDNGSGCTQTYCDMLTNVDSLNRSTGLSLQVIDVPPFQSVVTGISEMSSLQQVEVFPNPFNNNTTFTITSKQNAVYSFEMTDVLGKTVKTITNITDHQFSVSRDGLQDGIYFYRIYSSAGLIGIGKVVVR